MNEQNPKLEKIMNKVPGGLIISGDNVAYYVYLNNCRYVFNKVSALYLHISHI